MALPPAKQTRPRPLVRRTGRPQCPERFFSCCHQITKGVQCDVTQRETKKGRAQLGLGGDAARRSRKCEISPSGPGDAAHRVGVRAVPFRRGLVGGDGVRVNAQQRGVRGPIPHRRVLPRRPAMQVAAAHAGEAIAARQA